MAAVTITCNGSIFYKTPLKPVIVLLSSVGNVVFSPNIPRKGVKSDAEVEQILNPSLKPSEPPRFPGHSQLWAIENRIYSDPILLCDGWFSS
jgi:hypothetical protein